MSTDSQRRLGRGGIFGTVGGMDADRSLHGRIHGDPENVSTTEAPSGTDSNANILRIASYNIHRCVGGDGLCDANRVVSVIQELHCDTVGLQEVDNRSGGKPESMQLDFIAAATGMSAVPGMRLITHEGHYGNALLTRRRVLSVQWHDLSYLSFEPRGALDVELEAGSGTVRVLVTHLGLMPWERRHQTRKILEIVAQAPPDQTVILLGDINEWLPLGRPLRWLHTLFGRPPCARSFPAARPLFALDRIWVRPRAALLDFSVHRSDAASIASDHLPVKAIVAIEAPSDRSPPHEDQT